MLRKSLARTLDNFKRVKYMVAIAQEHFDVQKSATALSPIDFQKHRDCCEKEHNNFNFFKKMYKYSSFIYTPQTHKGSSNLLNVHSLVLQNNVLLPNIWNYFKRFSSTEISLVETIEEPTNANKKDKKRLRMSSSARYYNDTSNEVKKQSRCDEQLYSKETKKSYNQTWADFPKNNMRRKPLVLPAYPINEMPKLRDNSTRTCNTLSSIDNNYELQRPASKGHRKERDQNRKSSYPEDYPKQENSMKRPCAPTRSFSEMKYQEERQNAIASKDSSKTKGRNNSY